MEIDLFPGRSFAGWQDDPTNPVTYEYMKELHDTVEGLQGREFAILPDAAIYWIKARQKNPLPTSWPLDFELAGPGCLTGLRRLWKPAGGTWLSWWPRSKDLNWWAIPHHPGIVSFLTWSPTSTRPVKPNIGRCMNKPFVKNRIVTAAFRESQKL